MTSAAITRWCKLPGAFRCWCAAAAGRGTMRFWSAPKKLIQQGVAGIVYGRNIIQHADPAGDDPRPHGHRA